MVVPHCDGNKCLLMIAYNHLIRQSFAEFYASRVSFNETQPPCSIWQLVRNFPLASEEKSAVGKLNH